MTDKKIEVKVIADGYIELAQSDNPELSAQVMALILADKRMNPPSADHVMMRQAEERAESAEQKARTDRYARERMEKELKELKEKVAALTVEAKTGAEGQKK